MITRDETLILRGAISMMDKDAREKLEECAELLRGTMVQYGDLGRIAATLVLSELVDEDNAKDQS